MLNLNDCPNFTNPGLEPLRALRCLRKLALGGCLFLGDRGMAVIGTLRTLEYLKLPGPGDVTVSVRLLQKPLFCDWKFNFSFFVRCLSHVAVSEAAGARQHDGEPAGGCCFRFKQRPQV